VTVYIGTLNTSLVRAAEIFREAILRNCAGVIVAHNHPTGNPQPSPEDVHMSRGLSAAGKLLDIPLHDHLIIGRDSWVSLKELGLLQA
jgi:DNA repair protein RadC